MTDAPPAPLSRSIKHGLRGHCPNCGQGKLFQSYLKIVDTCASCGEKLGTIRADDGPAWLSILIVGHILVPLLVMVTSDTDWPAYIVMPLFLFLTTALVLLVLPLAKGVFVAVIHHTKATER